MNRANIHNIPVVKNRSFMRNKGHVFGVRTITDRKIPCQERVRKIGYIKEVPFQKKRGCPNISVFFLLGGGGSGLFFPRQVHESNNFRTHVHCTVVHLSSFEVPDFQVFLSRLPKLTPLKSRLPEFES